MIGYLKGEVAGIYEDRIVLEVSGIGYNVIMPASSLDLIDGIGMVVKIYTYLDVREDAMLLYGFLTKDDLDFYKLLIQVNGVGPKAALSMLSVMTTDDLRFAILSDDAKKIGKAPGIGPKTAQRIIIDLKDKVHIEDAFNSAVIEKDETGVEDIGQARNEAAQALIALGYSQTDAYRSVRSAQISSDDDVETILKKALKNM